MADRTQADGLPSVSALQAFDEVIQGLEQAYNKLMADVLWMSVDGGAGTLVQQHTKLHAVLDALRAFRRPFNITTVTPAPIQKVVRV